MYELLNSDEITERNITGLIGDTLLSLQLTENLTRLIMTFVLQKDYGEGGLTYERLVEQTTAERAKTLGYFLHQLRQRAALDQKFDDDLRTFLKLRNQFVHDLSGVPGWDLRSEAGLRVAYEYLVEVLRYSTHVLMVFSGLLRRYQQDVGFPSPKGMDGILSMIDTDYAIHVDRIFQAKAPST